MVRAIGRIGNHFSGTGIRGWSRLDKRKPFASSHVPLGSFTQSLSSKTSRLGPKAGYWNQFVARQLYSLCPMSLISVETIALTFRSLLVAVMTISANCRADQRCVQGPLPRYLTNNQLHAAIEKVDAIYRPIFQLQKRHYLKFDFLNEHDSPLRAFYINYFVHEGYGLSTISIYGLDGGGYLSGDGLLALACHEFGHRMGGWPGVPFEAIEGQADYFAASRCLPLVFWSDDNQAIIKTMKIPLTVKSKCESVHLDKNRQAICMRTAMAGLSLFQHFHFTPACAKANSPNPRDEYFPDHSDEPAPSLDSHDSNEVDRTYGDHPQSQCRVDTFVAGALCVENPQLEYLPPNLIKPGQLNGGSCFGSNRIGIRPSCWFKTPEHVLTDPNQWLDYIR